MFPVHVPIHVQQDPFAGIVDVRKGIVEFLKELSGPIMVMLDDSLLAGSKEMPSSSLHHDSNSNSKNSDLPTLNKTHTTESRAVNTPECIEMIRRQRGPEIAYNVTRY